MEKIHKSTIYMYLVHTALTKPYKYLILLLILPQLIFATYCIVLLSLCKLNNLGGPQINSVVEVSEEEKMVEMVCEKELV